MQLLRYSDELEMHAIHASGFRTRRDCPAGLFRIELIGHLDLWFYRYHDGTLNSPTDPHEKTGRWRADGRSGVEAGGRAWYYKGYSDTVHLAYLTASSCAKISCFGKGG